MMVKEQIRKWLPEENITWYESWIEAEVPLDLLETNLLYTYEHLKFYWLKDICVVDNIEHSQFVIRYFLQNPQESIVLVVKACFNKEQVISSVAPIWKNAPGFESEVFEMFGVRFNYKTKRRYFCPQTSEFPLRKNFSKFNDVSIKTQNNLNSKFQIGMDFPMNSNDIFFSINLDDDVITDCSLDMGYHHFGLEKSLEDLNVDQVLQKINLASQSAGLHWNLAWAMLVENGNGIEIPDKAKGLRMILSELVRIKDHFKVLMQLAYKTDYVSFFNTTIYWYNRIIDLLNSFSERKSVHDTITIGGLRDDLPHGWMASCLDYLSILEKHLLDEYKFFYNNSFWFDRLQCGNISREEAMKYAVGGPTLRASGVNHDDRKRSPYYFYKEVSFEVPLGVNGFIYDRFLVYVEEIFQSIKIITQVLDNIPAGRILSEEVLDFNNYKASTGISDDVLYRRAIETSKSVNFQSSYARLESSNGLIDIWANFLEGSERTQRVKCSSNSNKLLNLFESNIMGEKLEDLEIFWISLGIKMSEVER